MKTIIGLKDGSYQLVETKAPTGYTIADPISFTVEKGKIYRSVDGEQAEIDTIAMEDQATEVIISKTDITTGKELPGATLQILKKVKAATDAGEEVEKEETVITIYGEKLEWVSGETPKTIKGLPAGEYILRETAAPNGYTIAKDVKFTVTDELKAAETVVMENAPIEVNISKTDITTDKELPGATLQILKKAAAVTDHGRRNRDRRSSNDHLRREAGVEIHRRAEEHQGTACRRVHPPRECSTGWLHGSSRCNLYRYRRAESGRNRRDAGCTD